MPKCKWRLEKLVFIQSKFHGERNKKKELKISGVEINKQKN
jgi:hypothetical protein